MDKLYLTIPEASEWAGIGEKTMRGFVNSDDPPPHLKIGAKVLIQRAKLAEYLEGKQTVRL